MFNGIGNTFGVKSQSLKFIINKNLSRFVAVDRFE